MKAKEYLRQLEMLSIRIDQKKRQLEELRYLAEGINAIDYAKDRVQSSPSSDSMSSAVIRCIEMEQEIAAQIEHYILIKDLIVNQIEGLKNPNYVTLLYSRYVDHKSLEKIAVDMNYSYPYIKEMHGYALLEFQRTYPNLLRNVLK